VDVIFKLPLYTQAALGVAPKVTAVYRGYYSVIHGYIAKKNPYKQAVIDFFVYHVMVLVYKQIALLMCGFYLKGATGVRIRFAHIKRARK
jgi:hypothetical protein